MVNRKSNKRCTQDLNTIKSTNNEELPRQQDVNGFLRHNLSFQISWINDTSPSIFRCIINSKPAAVSVSENTNQDFHSVVWSSWERAKKCSNVHYTKSMIKIIITKLIRIRESIKSDYRNLWNQIIITIIHNNKKIIKITTFKHQAIPNSAWAKRTEPRDVKDSNDCIHILGSESCPLQI